MFIKEKIMKKSVAVLAMLMTGLSPKAFAIEFQDAGAQLSQTLDMMERARVAQQIEEDRSRIDAKVKGEQTEEEFKGEMVEFTVTKFEYEKSEVLSAEQLKTLTDGYLNKSITIKDLYKLIGEINKLYADGGYVTCKAYLPPQRVTGGVVKLMFVEGTTGEIKLAFPNGSKSTRESYVKRRITKLVPGRIMDANELNKQIVYFNATNDAQLRVVLQPGQKNGTTDFIINVYEPQKFNHTFFSDNAGNENTGYYRGGYFMNIKSLTGNRDNMVLGAIYSKGSFMWSASYDTPISRSGTKLSLGYSGNATEIIGGDYANTNTKGHSTAYTVALRQPWVVNETTRSEAGVEFTHQSADTTTGGNQKWTDDIIRDLNVYFSHTSYGKSHFFYQKHSYAAYGNYTSGLAKNNDVSSLHYYKLNAYYQKAYQHRQAINIRFDAQKTWNENFPSSRHFFVGGMNTVRGYKESFTAGYSGYLISAEYQVPISKDFKHNMFVFHDYANVSGDVSATFMDHVLQSVGLGFKSNWTKHLYSCFTAGFPLRRQLNNNHVSGVRLNYMVSGTF